MPRTRSTPAGPASPALVPLLIALSTLTPVALNLTVPSLPAIAADLNAPYRLIQLSVTVFLVSVALAQLALGPLSDRYGRRPILLAGIGLFVLGSLGSALAGGVESLLAARIIQAAGGCAGMVLARAIIQDQYGRDHGAAVLGSITMAVAVAPMLAPPLGGYLELWVGWRAGFLGLALLGGLILAWTAFGLAETGRRGGGGEIRRDLLPLIRLGAFWRYSLVVALSNGVFFAFLGAAPLVAATSFGMSPQAYGSSFMLVAGGFIMGNFVSARRSRRVGPLRMIRIGVALALLAAGLIVLGAVTTGLSPLWLFGPMILSAIANGLITPNGLAAAISLRPDIAGTTAGLAGAIQMGVGAAASAGAGFLIDGGTGAARGEALAWLMLGLAGLAAMLGMWRDAAAPAPVQPEQA
ncbi:MAG: hypothetical protein RLZZ501_2548 [Pseudomonadota bacterium]